MKILIKQKGSETMAPVRLQEWRFVGYFPTSAFSILYEYITENNLEIWELHANLTRQTQNELSTNTLPYLTINEIKTFNIKIKYNYFKNQAIDLPKLRKELEDFGIENFSISRLGIAIPRKDLGLPKTKKQSVKLIASFNSRITSGLEFNNRFLEIIDSYNKDVRYRGFRTTCLDLTALRDSKDWALNKCNGLDVINEPTYIQKIRSIIDVETNFLKIRSLQRKSQNTWSLVDAEC